MTKQWYFVDRRNTCRIRERLTSFLFDFVIPQLQERIGLESKDVANEWMEYVNSVDGLLDVSPVVYENSNCELDDFEEVEYALTWLFWLNESEGSGTRMLLDKLTSHPSAELRLGLVRSIRELRLPSNGVSI